MLKKKKVCLIKISYAKKNNKNCNMPLFFGKGV